MSNILDLENIKWLMNSKHVTRIKRRVTGDRKENTFFASRVVAKYSEKLTGEMPKAMEHIARAPMLYETPGGIRSVNLMAVSSGKPKDNLSDWEIDLKKRYEKWRGLMQSSPMALSVVENVCQLEKSLEDIRKQERISYSTAEKLFHYGLNEFCHVSGWGEQLEEK